MRRSLLSARAKRRTSVPKEKTALFAIVRLDAGDGPLRNRIYVTRVVADLETAEAEVVRLQQLNGDKGCEYFWTPTRMHGSWRKEA
jgi:hypothetical protein